jgi:hypothetical protein
MEILCDEDNPGTVLEFKRMEGSKLYFLEATRDENPEALAAAIDGDNNDDDDDEEPDEGVPPSRYEINRAHRLLGHPGVEHLRTFARAHNWTLTSTLDQCSACERAKATNSEANVQDCQDGSNRSW